MADFAASDVTYTLVNRRKLGDHRNLNRVRLAFGDGALTYAAGGIPLSKGKMGCPVVIESLIVVDSGTSGYRFVYDQSAEKLVVLHQGAHTHSLSLKNAAVADGATTRVNAGTNLLGANTGSDITIAGGGANGGIANTTPGASAEATAVALAAQTIEVEVIGW